MKEANNVTRGKTNVPVEAMWLAEDEESAARADVDVRVEGPGGRVWIVPAFHDGGRLLGFRFAAPVAGKYKWVVKGHRPEACAPSTTGEFDIAQYDGDNPLYKHGRLRVAADKRHLEHADGTPYLWLADTWWMALSSRCDWPRGFRALAADRIAKGFNTVQLVAGPFPDYCSTTDVFNPQHANEGGLPWLQKDGAYEFGGINPAYYRHADDKIFALAEWGLTPCIFATWGHLLPFAGVENMKRHWRNLVARYAALPVVWTLCGELDLPAYAYLGEDLESRGERQRTQRAGWAEVAKYLRSIDPYGTLVSAHPWSRLGTRGNLSDPATYDLDMLQTGHGNQEVLPGTSEQMREFYRRSPPLPVLNAEPCYEGIMGVAGAAVARAVFWISIVEGGLGHTYGAQGIWAMNSRDKPFRGTTLNWGDGWWQDAMHYAGSADVGRAKRFLEKFEWWRLVPRDEPAVVAAGRPTSLAAEIPGKLLLYYIANKNAPESMRGISLDGAALGAGLAPIALEPGSRWRAFFWNPRTGEETPAGVAAPEADGNWAPPPRPSMEDWVFVMGNGKLKIENKK